MQSTGPDTGSLIGGHFRLRQKLGEGSMGVVYLAHDELLARDVAIKFMRRSALDDDFRRRFKDEALAMARVSHVNVVLIHALGEHEEVPYFVMEYVAGRTLDGWCSPGNPKPDIEATLRVLEQACDGVSAIHAANTLHRDIKPGNILIDSSNRAKIADLGLAMEGKGASESSEVAGSPAFMAPEIGFQRKVDPALGPRADVYSLACVAYEMFTGRTPFVAPNALTMIVQHAHREAPPPSTFRPELSPAIDQAIMQALVKDPAKRTASAAAFRRDLIAGRDGEPARILVAEDNDDFRALIHFQLSREFPEAEIVAVADGEQALAAFDERTPSIVILDLQMPGLDGMELTALIRSRELTSRVPILVLTASGTPKDWQRLSALGADRFLVKPVVFDDVATLVRRSLRERSTSSVPPLTG